VLLDGMRVVSFCHFLQGPAATQYLGDMGADVIKVEAPKGAFERYWAGGNAAYVDGVSAFYLCANRNKRSLAIDLKRPEAREIIYRLIEGADALVENFRPGVMDRLGFGYEEVRRRKPDIIYASASGYGPDGPMRERPGQDLLIQALTGLVASTGDLRQRPTPIGFAVADQHGAALIALGVAGAYVKKLKTGQGTRIDATLFNAGIDLQNEPLTLYFTGKAAGRPSGREAFERDPRLATWYHEAPYGVYRLSDCFIVVSMSVPAKLAEALDSGPLRALCDVDRYAERDRYAKALAEELGRRSYAEVAEAFDAHAIWYARVQEYDDLPDDPQARHAEVFREVRIGSGTATLVNHPLRYDGEVPPLRHLSVKIGEDTRAVLGELGYGDAEIEALLKGGVVAAPPADDDGATEE
jgi:crotonobetainyl-CoA:carnitine CoA-transferase CaiB-like acyl-CoA transferase